MYNPFFIFKRSPLHKAIILAYRCLYILFATPIYGTQPTEQQVKQALRDTCLYYEDQYQKQAFSPKHYFEAPTYDYRMIWFAARVLENRLKFDTPLLNRFGAKKVTDDKLIQLTQAHFSVIKKLPPTQATSNYDRLKRKKEIGARIAVYFFREKLRTILQQEPADNSSTQAVQNEENDFFTFLTTNFLQYNLPGTTHKLGIFSERHLERNKKACEIVLKNLSAAPRNKERFLLIEVKKLVTDRYKENKKTNHKGVNTRYILKRYFSKKNMRNMTGAEKDRVVSCEYRDRKEWLGKTIPSLKRKGIHINELVYFMNHWPSFLELPLGELLLTNERAQNLWDELSSNPILIENNAFNEFYLKARARLVAKAQFRNNELSAINPILKRNKDKTVDEVFGEDRNLADAIALCWNSNLDIKIFDDTIYHLTKGHTDLKTGSEHGYNLHASMMYAVQSDEAFKASLKEWKKHYQTPVQARYALARLKDLMEKEPLRVTVHTRRWKWFNKWRSEFSIARIFSSIDNYHQGVAILQFHASPKKQARIGIAYENITSIELNPSISDMVKNQAPHTSFVSNEESKAHNWTWLTAGAIPIAAAASSYITYQKRVHPPLKKRRRKGKK